MGNCKSCDGSCSPCGGCGGSLELTQGEMDLLRELGQYSFLPVARRASDMTPVYLEQRAYTKEEYSLILQCLERKGLISIDYAKPLPGADMSSYEGYQVHGSMALTQRGQQVIALLDVQGIEA